MVKSAIESALNQTYPNIEVIVVDDGSTDSTQDLVSSYHDPRLTYFKNPKNLGQFPTCNRCIELSRGKYIHILHSDDFIDSHFTQTCIEFMESNPHVGMTFSSYKVIFDGEQKKTGISDHDMIFPAPNGFRKILETSGMVMCPTVIIKRDVYDSVGLFSCEYPYSGDYYQWLKIAQYVDIAFVANAILFYRQGEHTESFKLLFKTPLGRMDNIKIFIRLIDELGDDVALYRCELNIAIRRQMRECLYAAVLRSGLMKSYSPLVLIGFSMNHWSLIRPESLIDRIKKCAECFFILSLGCVLLIPGGRYCILLISRPFAKSLS